MKEIIWLFLIIILPAIVFLCPFGIAFYTGNFWYIALVCVTWFPAMILAGFFIHLYDNLK
jgi:hypothetical protein